MTLSEKETAYLVKGLQKFCDRDCVAFTINCPRTHSFKKLQSNDQKRLYKIIIRKALDKMDKTIIGCYEYTFEYCKDGHVHMHGIVHMNKGNNMVGYLMDLDRTLRLIINKLLNKKTPYKDCYNDNFKRIQKPAYCLQLLLELENIEHWYKYMYKDQPKSSDV
nr:MAG TPA: replication protein A [Bacteriophage sp.]